jgi:hypothetical protein
MKKRATPNRPVTVALCPPGESTRSFASRTVCVFLLAFLPASAMGIAKDDFLLVPHFPGQVRDNLYADVNQKGDSLLQWSELASEPWQGTWQLLYADGTPIGAAIDVDADMQAMGLEYDYSLPAFLPGGKLLAVHQVEHDTFLVQANDLVAVQRTYLQFFDSMGITREPPIRLSDTLDPWLHWGMRARGVEVDADSVITLLFRDYGSTHGRCELYLARYDILGNGLGPWIHVTEGPNDVYQTQTESMVGNGHGRIIVLWDSDLTDPVIQVPFFRVYNHDLPVTDVTPFTCLGGPVLNCGDRVFPCYIGTDAHAALNPDGSFAVVHQGCDATYHDSGGSIFLWLFDANGQPVLGPKTINDFATHVVSNSPKIVADYDSGYVAAWVAFPWYPLADMFLQRLGPGGQNIGYNYRANTPIGTLEQQAFFLSFPDADGYTNIWYDGREWVPYRRDIYAEVVPRGKVGVKQNGDVNYDGFVNASDIIHLVNYVFKSSYGPYGFTNGGDMNGNCTTTAADIIYLVNFVFKTGWPPVGPCSGP